ncbi:SH3 domain-containing protein [Gloeocapsa sp. PCC 73106]|uniref:SH3 domain-containing protein n=1 Tax=Gloeocapsa sp. PCC 73106 TaxID=102232 RepID=UPI0002AC8150|nr:SH3 domain-containing protein [Gloeocapsa sp. PCC 73106]ELR96663.1 SH3 domain-containing protein [Gloeocapsa sp. PCC 73106]
MRVLWRAAQFTLGFVLGMTLFVGVSAIMAYFFLSQLARIPPKPLFPEIVTPAETPVLVEPEAIETEIAEPPPSVAEPEPEVNVYRARVTWSDGLTIRAEPNMESERLGGVAYDQELVIFGDDQVDGWQKILVPGTDIQGWVRADNLQRVN